MIEVQLELLNAASSFEQLICCTDCKHNFTHSVLFHVFVSYIFRYLGVFARLALFKYSHIIDFPWCQFGLHNSITPVNASSIQLRVVDYCCLTTNFQFA